MSPIVLAPLEDDELELLLELLELLELLALLEELELLLDALELLEELELLLLEELLDVSPLEVPPLPPQALIAAASKVTAPSCAPRLRK